MLPEPGGRLPLTRYDLGGVRAATDAPQRAFIAHATSVLRADDRVAAVWLVGGFAVGNADAFSDIDLQVLAARDGVADWWREVVDALAPTVSVRSFGAVAGGVCITPEWLHFDVVFHAPGTVDPRDVTGMVPLVDKAGLLPDGPVPRPFVPGPPFFPADAVELFLYMLGNMVAVVGRDEVVPGMNGVTMVRDLALVGLLLAENGIVTTREHGGGNAFAFTKRLRTYLTPEQNAVLAALPPVAPSIESVIDGYVALARAFLPRARRLAEATGAEWPEAYERATVAYFERMLGAHLDLG